MVKVFLDFSFIITDSFNIKMPHFGNVTLETVSMCLEPLLWLFFKK